MVLCIIPPNLRLLAEICKESERESRSARTDGRMDGRNDRRQYPLGAFEAKYSNPFQENDRFYTGLIVFTMALLQLLVSLRIPILFYWYHCILTSVTKTISAWLPLVRYDFVRSKVIFQPVVVENW